MNEVELKQAVKDELPLQVRGIGGGWVDMYERDPFSIDPKYIRIKPKTGAQRVKESEERKYESGLRKAWEWVYPQSREKLRAYALKLRTDVERGR